MKILQISPYIDPRLGGQEKHVLALSQMLSSAGHEVTIITSKYDPNTVPKKVRVVLLPAVSFFGVQIIYPFSLISFLLKNRFDVCHIHYQTLFGETVLLITKVCKLPAVTTLHSEMIRSKYIKVLYDRITLILTSSLSCKVLCLSPQIMKVLIQRGAKSSKCVVIPNAVNVTTLKNYFQKVKKQTSLPEFDLLFVGRLEKRKGILCLLDSLIILRDQGCDVTLKIVGQGELANQINDVLQSTGLNKNVELKGYLSEENLAELFLSTKCVVIPSFYEGVPTIALEAMVAEKPLIVSNIPGLGELVKDGLNGVVVRPMDALDLSLGIKKILTMPKESSLIQFNSSLLSTYDWNTVVKQISALYKQCIDK